MLVVFYIYNAYVSKSNDPIYPHAYVISVYNLIYCIAFSSESIIQLLAASSALPHWGLVTPFGGIDLGQHWLR